MGIPSNLPHPALLSPNTTSDGINENALKVLGLESLFEKICSNLDPKDMNNLLQTCKTIKSTHDRLKESNPNHYHLLFAKTFGCSNEDKTCSNVEKALKKASRSGNLTLINALMTLNKFKEINPNSLGWALEKASKKGYLDIVQALIASEKFKEISLHCLNRVLRTSHLPIAEALIPQYYSLLTQASNTNTQGLGRALRRYSGSGELNMVEDLIRSPGFQEINSDDLGWALESAVSNNHLPIVEAFIESGRFQEIDPYYLGWSLREASEKGYLSTAQALIACNRFQEISSDDLGWALENASKHNSIYILEDIGFTSNDPNSFSIIPIYAKRGSKEGYPLNVQSLITSNRFQEIDPHYLNLALIEAAENGELNIVQTLITSNKFQEVNLGNLDKAFKKASEKGHLPVVKVLNSFRTSQSSYRKAINFCKIS